MGCDSLGERGRAQGADARNWHELEFRVRYWGDGRFRDDQERTVSVDPPGGGILKVTTTDQKESYAVKLAPRRLEPGRYALILRGRVDFGGLHLGGLDAGVNAWISVSSYSFDQPGMGQKPMVVMLDLAHPTLVQPILANWNPLDGKPNGRSRWRLRDLTVVRLN